MYEYEKNTWNKYQTGIPMDEQVDSIITEKKLRHMEDGIERASMTLEVGNVTTGDKGEVLITEDNIKNRRLINVVFPKGGEGGANINDLVPSNKTTYSSSKIDQMIQELRKELVSTPTTAIKISSFTGTESYYEKGRMITSLTFRWATNIDPVSVTLNGNAVDPGMKTIIYPCMIDSDTSFVLRVTDKNGNTDMKTLYVRYYTPVLTGVGTGTDIASIKPYLTTKTFNPSNPFSFTTNPGTGEYIYYADPNLTREPQFFNGGFEGGFEYVGVADITNSYDYTTAYNVWRSTNHSLGRTTMEVR